MLGEEFGASRIFPGGAGGFRGFEIFLGRVGGFRGSRIKIVDHKGVWSDKVRREMDFMIIHSTRNQ